jgi:predicted house-cleaning NTP pyrophosphatase (Maf/HAM1 superfamily)
VSPSNFEENLNKEEFKNSLGYVVETSRRKLMDKFEELKNNNTDCDIIIAADTIISVNDKEVFEKPKDRDDAFRMLRLFSDI